MRNFLVDRLSSDDLAPKNKNHLVFNQPRLQQGFSLIEILIVLAIIGVLSAIAIPAYQQHTRKAHYLAIVMASQPYKMAVELCYQVKGDLSVCDENQSGIPAGITAPKAKVKRLTVVDGVITVTPVAAEGILEADTYILTPTAGSPLTWISSGGGVNKGYVAAN